MKGKGTTPEKKPITLDESLFVSKIDIKITTAFLTMLFMGIYGFVKFQFLENKENVISEFLKFPLTIGILYILAYSILIFILISISEKINNKYLNILVNILSFPGFIFLVISFLYKKFIEPLLLPLIIIVSIVCFSFLSPILLVSVFVDSPTEEWAPFVYYISLTLSSIVLTTSLNPLYQIIFHRNDYFNEGESEKEIQANNDFKYAYGFSNFKKIKEKSLKVLNQKYIIFAIYCLYFLGIIVSSIIAILPKQYILFDFESSLKVLIASFATYIAFERILKNRNLIALSDKSSNT